jgi:hypothetical protein
VVEVGGVKNTQTVTIKQRVSIASIARQYPHFTTEQIREWHNRQARSAGTVTRGQVQSVLAELRSFFGGRVH